MPDGIDYRLIQDIGGARARGAAQAVSQEANVAALQDYMAKQQARTAVGGEAGAAGYYEQDLRRDAYTKDVESKMPFIQQMITVGDREGLEGINQGFAATHGDLHTTQLDNLIPGKYAELSGTQTGEALVAQFPEMAQANLDPTGSYTVNSRIGADGSMEVTGIAPAIPTEMKTPFGKIDPSKYTSESVTDFQQTGDYGKLVPREKPLTGKAAALAGKAKLRATEAKQKIGIVLNKIDEASEQLGFFSTGATAQFSKWIDATPAGQLTNTIRTVQAITGFDELRRMKESSPTGGALGQVSEFELKNLQSVIASLEVGQPEAQLRNNLKQVKNLYENLRANMNLGEMIERNPALEERIELAKSMVNDKGERRFTPVHIFQRMRLAEQMNRRQ